MHAAFSPSRFAVWRTLDVNPADRYASYAALSVGVLALLLVLVL